MNKVRLLTFFFLTWIVVSARAQKDTCKVGMLVNAIYDLNIGEKSFTTNYWIWLLYKNDSLDFQNNIEFHLTKKTEKLHFIKEKKNGINWVQEKYRNVMLADWDIRSFPFDKQTISILIGSAELDTSKLIFVADTENSKVDPHFYPDEWEITKFRISSLVETDPTTCGDPASKGNSSYSNVQADITISRKHSWLLMFKLLTGLIVAFLVAISSFLIEIRNTSPRFSICVGALFAAVANKHIIESRVPDKTAITLIDNIHSFTFVMIFLVISLSAMFLKLAENKPDKTLKQIKKADIISWFTFLVTYSLVIFILIVHAINPK